jgi:hypothetical protein
MRIYAVMIKNANRKISIGFPGMAKKGCLGWRQPRERDLRTLYLTNTR